VNRDKGLSYLFPRRGAGSIPVMYGLRRSDRLYFGQLPHAFRPEVLVGTAAVGSLSSTI